LWQDEADGGLATRPADLTSDRRPPLQRVRESWRETGYPHRLDSAITEPRLSRCVTIAVVSPKGGVGKTTMAALIGSLLSRLRHERMVAVDANPDYGSLGRTLTPEHGIFVDDLIDILANPDLTAIELDRKLGRGFDGLRVLPAPTDPARMARLDRLAYATVFKRLQTMVDGLILDCGTGLQEPRSQAAIEAADQIVLVSDAEPSTASLVAEAADLLKRSDLPFYLVVNKMPRSNGQLNLDALSRAVRDAQTLVTLRARPLTASRVSSGEFSWDRPPDDWALALRELCAVMVADWPDLGLST
ncbi:MAG: MinD/ParA family protein, partial [Solirubrobacterales bacterium]